jgi:4-amino-4-deoxy-L-arabinose transferase-like glycosyltransferase
LAWLLLAALVVRLGAAVWWQSRVAPGRQFEFGDSESYWRLGQAIVRGEPYEYGSPDAKIFRAPGYPLLLAAMFSIVGTEPPVLWARALSAALGTLAVAGVYWLARVCFDPTTGLVAAGLAAIYPGAIGMSVYVLSEAPFCPLMLAQLAMWAAAGKRSWGTSAVALAVGAGLAGGLATLMRPSWLLFSPMAVLLCVPLCTPHRKHLALGAVLLLTLAAVVTPWWIRNAKLTGHFVATTLQVGASLYDGLHPSANGASHMDFVPGFTAEARRRYDEAVREAAPESQSGFEFYLDREFRGAAIAWARQNPRRVLELVAIKFARMWNIWPNESDFRSWPMRLMVLGSYVPLLVLGWWGVWKFGRPAWPLMLCWLPPIYFTALHVVFVSSVRYREPAMLALLVPAAAMLKVWLGPKMNRFFNGGAQASLAAGSR